MIVSKSRHWSRGAGLRAWICGAMGLLSIALTWALPGTALAYPQWQFSSGAARCNQCHFAPGGGGLINGYGRDAVGEELSSRTGEGAFLHGKLPLPARAALGGDLRLAALGHDTEEAEGATFAAFPMQAELSGRFSWPTGFSVGGSVGLRGRVRSNSSIVPRQNYQPMPGSRLISREHHLTFQPASVGGYLRAGRFFAPFGLRLSEHFTYVRRDLGFGSLQESYNLSAGWVANAWELHVTGFLPDGLRHMGATEKGVAALFEQQLPGGNGALGLQVKLGYGPGMDRMIAGLTAKQYIEPVRTLLVGEANLVRQSFDVGGIASRNQLVALAGLCLLPARGWMLTVLGERSQSDVDVADTATTATSGILTWFPIPHLELQVLGRLQFPAGSPTAKTVLAQVHYFL